MAGVLVAILLGVLAFFDYLANPPDEAEPTVFTKPVPVAPKEVSQPVKPPTENLPEPPPPKGRGSGRTAAATERRIQRRRRGEVKYHLRRERPVVTAKPDRPSAWRRRQRRNRYPSPVAGAGSDDGTVQSAAGQRAVAPAGRHPPSRLPVWSKPNRRLLAQPPVVNRLFSGFLLQAGVFQSPAGRGNCMPPDPERCAVNAVETRVQVGPFRTRQEAEAAQAKLKQLGSKPSWCRPRRRAAACPLAAEWFSATHRHRGIDPARQSRQARLRRMSRCRRIGGGRAWLRAGRSSCGPHDDACCHELS